MWTNVYTSCIPATLLWQGCTQEHLTQNYINLVFQSFHISSTDLFGSFPRIQTMPRLELCAPRQSDFSSHITAKPADPAFTASIHHLCCPSPPYPHPHSGLLCKHFWRQQSQLWTLEHPVKAQLHYSSPDSTALKEKTKNNFTCNTLKQAFPTKKMNNL